MFAMGDQVMVFLGQEKFPVDTYSKLQSKKYSPYQIVKKIHDNTYVVALPDSIEISKTFNVADIYLYYSSNKPMYSDIPNSRSSFFQVGETNAEDAALDFLEKWDRCEKTKSGGTGRSDWSVAQYCGTSYRRHNARFQTDIPFQVSGRFQAFSIGLLCIFKPQNTQVRVIESFLLFSTCILEKEKG